MELTLQRNATDKETTLGDLAVNGEHFCFTLEDAVREQPGVPVARWKVKGQTAIPTGRYLVTLNNSPRFGPETITINGVEGFDFIRVHGGNSKDSTEGCVIVGDQIDAATARISGALLRGVLGKLKDKIRYALTQDGEVWISIKNPLNPRQGTEP